MSLEQPNATEVRRTVKSVVELHDYITIDELVSEVAGRYDCHEAVVVDQLDEMERHGFVYLVPDGDTQEVRLP